MGQHTDVHLIDDLDGSDADLTCTFGLDGVTYEIELTEANYQRLQDTFAPYVDAGRRAPAARRWRRKFKQQRA